MDEWDGDLGQLAAPIPTAHPTPASGNAATAGFPDADGETEQPDEPGYDMSLDDISMDMSMESNSFQEKPSVGEKRPPGPVKAPSKKRQRTNQSTFSAGGRQQALAKIMAGRRKLGKIKGYLFGELFMECLAMDGTKVKLEAANDNPADPRAVKVLDDSDGRLGQIDIKTARVFHDALEAGKAELEGLLAPETQITPPAGQYIRQVEISVSFYGTGLDVQRLCQSSKEQRVEWSDKSPVFRLACGDPVTTQELVEANDPNRKMLERVENDFNLVFDGNALALEGIDPPPEIIPTLKQHQREALEWMDHRENPGFELSAFFEEFRDAEGVKWRNKVTDQIVKKRPQRERGGILADDMGLGKTLQAICLMIKNRRDEEGFNLGPTLIICPVSVIGNWETQMEEHCEPGALEIYLYHGRERNSDPEFLASHDVVISTYDILAREWSKRKEDEERAKKDGDFKEDSDKESDEDSFGFGDDEADPKNQGIYNVEWLRVMLDEAHKIRNQNTVKFKALCAVKAKIKWALTGTPMQNRLDDLWSLFCFVGVHPLTEQRCWRALVVDPMRQGREELGLTNLRKILSKVCLRRTKENTKSIVLPPKNDYMLELDFDVREQSIYTELLEQNAATFDKLDNQGTVLKNYHNVLKMLMRLRQCCVHYGLLPKKESTQKSEIKLELRDMLKNSDQECELCFKSADDPQISKCGHFICCKDCLHLELHTSSTGLQCPYCGQQITKSNVDSLDAPEDDKSSKKKKYQKFVLPPGEITPSTKIRELISRLNGMPYESKAVVFSQWTSFLDIIGRCLEQEGIIYERLDGSMTKKRRDRAIEGFKRNPNCKAIIMSLKAGNLGLNLTEADTIFMMDPWWNPSAEDQAVDRVYRLGQTREVHIYRLVISDSVESKILEIQNRKRLLVKMSMGKKPSKEKLAEMRLKDLRSLFKS